MATTLTALQTRLELMTATIDDVPGAAQKRQALVDAVEDFSRRAPQTKRSTLTIESGTRSYALPGDLLHIVRIEYPYADGGVVVSPDGLIPATCNLSVRNRERYTVVGRTLIYDTVPRESGTRTLFYAAKWSLDDDEIYQDMFDREAEIVVLRAAATVCTLQANVANASGISEYKQGDITVKRHDNAARLRAAADDWLKRYEAAVRDYIGAQGQRAWRGDNCYNGYNGYYGDCGDGYTVGY